ncbi:MAG: hypothetical protein J3K34DRAFT_494618 [Monoraphidium minutum]|nr:MAG: hypothetical protein J3K34DRAFT_494618 [Monoraphidium minutum]
MESFNELDADTPALMQGCKLDGTFAWFLKGEVLKACEHTVVRRTGPRGRRAPVQAEHAFHMRFNDAALLRRARIVPRLAWFEDEVAIYFVFPYAGSCAATLCAGPPATVADAEARLVLAEEALSVLAPALAWMHAEAWAYVDLKASQLVVAPAAGRRPAAGSLVDLGGAIELGGEIVAWTGCCAPPEMMTGAVAFMPTKEQLLAEPNATPNVLTWLNQANNPVSFMDNDEWRGLPAAAAPLKAVVSRLLRSTPGARPTPAELLAEPYVAGLVAAAGADFDYAVELKQRAARERRAAALLAAERAAREAAEARAAAAEGALQREAAKRAAAEARLRAADERRAGERAAAEAAAAAAARQIVSLKAMVDAVRAAVGGRGKGVRREGGGAAGAQAERAEEAPAALRVAADGWAAAARRALPPPAASLGRRRPRLAVDSALAAHELMMRMR